MFTNLDPKLLDDPDFKEDSVRELIITPLLARLGYQATGTSRVIRSKSLKHPFIYIGTTKHNVTVIPDYTLLHDDKPVFVLDAKAPNVDLAAQKNVQQAYSYAIHPEVRCEHFGLCNGRELVVYSVSESKPLLRMAFDKFDSDWQTIESFMLPKFLLQPALRKFRPDAGTAMRVMGLQPTAILVFMGARLDGFGRISDREYTAHAGLELAERTHAISFDFAAELLPQLVAGLPDQLREGFLSALSRAPFQANAGLCIEVDIECHLGDEVEGKSETFTPLVITKVLGARFNPSIPDSAGMDTTPPSYYRLRDHFKIRHA